MTADLDEWRYAAQVDADRFVDEHDCDYDEANERMAECEECGGLGDRDSMRGSEEGGYVCRPCDRRNW